jgi:hypothetical protein
MNKNAQLDFHPDAESLNAFAEQALGDRERGQIVEHLAVCSRCREVVFLAQEAAVEMALPAVAAAGRAAAVREPWFRNWRFAWVPLGAMAAVVTLAYVVHIRRVETDTEMAKVTNQAAPQMGTYASQAAAPPANLQAAQQRAAAPGPAQSRPSELKAKKRTEEASQLALSAPAAPAPAAQAPAVAPRAGMNELADGANNKAAQAPGAAGSSYQATGALAGNRQEPADAALKKEQDKAATAGEMRGLAARKMEKASADEVQKQVETDRLQAAVALAETVEVSPAPAVGRGVGGGRAASGAFAVYKAKVAGLPSGLAAVSTAVAQQSVLAVDKAGSVFLSEDSGIHWESVARQWNGRAVAVRTLVAAREGASGGSGSPETGFELVNDQGQVWASTDGKTWKIK